jgi:hypothetical protein
MTKRSIAVLVLIETDDKRLFPEKIDLSTIAGTARLRQAVIDNLPKMTRVVMVTSEATARMMAEAHAMAAGMGLGEIEMPPANYIPPTRD